MTITTPEQMREAANNDEDLIRRIDAITVAHQYTTSLDDPRMFAEMRAIPIAPQPDTDGADSLQNQMLDMIEANIDTMKLAMETAGKRIAELEAELAACKTHPMAVTVNHIGLRCERARISIPAAMCGAPYIGSYDYVALSALSHQPADPLSDPRVKALVEAAGKLRRSVCGPTGFADAVRHNSGQAYPWPSLDAAELALDAALRAIGGEA